MTTRRRDAPVTATVHLPAPAGHFGDPDLGPRGGDTKVTISGSGFNGATAVDFGSAPSTNFTVKPTKIVAYPPAVSGSRLTNITVTTPGGTSPTSAADQFTYTSGKVRRWTRLTTQSPVPG